MAERSERRDQAPLAWVPTAYLAMGLIYVTVGSMASILFRNLGVANDRAALWSSILAFPYTLKFSWAPLLEVTKNKKRPVVLLQLAIAVALGSVAVCVGHPGWGWPTAVLAMLMVVAFLGATQDIGSDGIYVTTLAPEQMARYTGVQGMCWNAGFLVAGGPLIYITGKLHQRSGSWPFAWMTALLVVAGVMMLLALYHMAALPSQARDDANQTASPTPSGSFLDAFRTFFQKRDILRLIAFSLLFRLGYGLLDKVGPLFILDDRGRGGLGFSNELLGAINGIFGTVAFVLGALLCGMIVSRFGLQRTLLVFWLCFNLPNVAFLVLSLNLPTNAYFVGALVIVEKIGWGLGCTSHIIYMMQQIAPGRYRTAHYTFASALMSAGMMATGAVSGYLQVALGYRGFFVVVLLAAIPSLAVAVLAPFHQPEQSPSAA